MVILHGLYLNIRVMTFESLEKLRTKTFYQPRSYRPKHWTANTTPTHRLISNFSVNNNNNNKMTMTLPKIPTSSRFCQTLFGQSAGKLAYHHNLRTSLHHHHHHYSHYNLTLMCFYSLSDEKITATFWRQLISTHYNAIFQFATKNHITS